MKKVLLKKQKKLRNHILIKASLCIISNWLIFLINCKLKFPSSEKNNDFGENFIRLAREVYKFNDERAKIKLAINNALGSNIKEVKSYE